MSSYQGTLATQPTGQLLFFNVKQTGTNNNGATSEVDASNSNSASTVTQQACLRLQIRIKTCFRQ